MSVIESKKRLGFGLMRLPLLNPDNPANIDVEQVKQMVDTFLERGFTYFDTAWMYHSFQSENVVKEALVDRYPRDSYTLATKLHAGFIKTKEDRDKVFEEQRRERPAWSILITICCTISASITTRPTRTWTASAG